MTIEAVGTLARFKLLAGMPAAVLRALEQRCRFRRYAREAAIIDYQDDRSDVFFIVNGQVRVTIYSSAGREVAFHDLDAGELFGEPSRRSTATHAPRPWSHLPTACSRLNAGERFLGASA